MLLFTANVPQYHQQYTFTINKKLALLPLIYQKVIGLITMQYCGYFGSGISLTNHIPVLCKVCIISDEYQVQIIMNGHRAE